MHDAIQMVKFRAVGDALEMQCLAGNLERFAKVTGRLDLLRDARMVRRLGSRIVRQIDGDNEAA